MGHADITDAQTPCGAVDGHDAEFSHRSALAPTELLARLELAGRADLNAHCLDTGNVAGGAIQLTASRGSARTDSSGSDGGLKRIRVCFAPAGPGDRKSQSVHFPPFLSLTPAPPPFSSMNSTSAEPYTRAAVTAAPAISLVFVWQQDDVEHYPDDGFRVREIRVADGLEEKCNSRRSRWRLTRRNGFDFQGPDRSAPPPAARSSGSN